MSPFPPTPSKPFSLQTPPSSSGRSESALLIDPSQDDLTQQQQVVATISHEVVHQWFGNLVTMRDWTELWLKEGFAT